MMGVSRVLRGFTTRDLVIIAVLAAMGIAVKPVVVPLAHLVSAPLFIPGGALAGGLYMMWLVVGMGIVGKRGTATLIALVQALLVMLTGVVGSHGALSLVSYTMPGIAVDLGLYLMGHRACCLRCCFVAGILANVTGTLMVSFIFFRLPPIPLALALCTAALSGGLGGALAWEVIKALRKYRIGTSVGRAATGSTLLAVAAFAVAVMMGAGGCSAQPAAGGTSASPGASAGRIPIVWGESGKNDVLSPGRVFTGRHTDAAQLSLAEVLRALDGGARTERVAVYGADGSVRRLPAAACAFTADGQVLVHGSSTGPVVGIVADPPPATITDVYRLARRQLAAGGRTLVIYLDGFGYDQYASSKKAGRIPNMARLSAREALTVYPTITPVTFASMISGEDPSVTGVHDRSTHRLACSSLYAWAEQRGLSTCLIEGNLQILALTQRTELNVDGNGDGSTDDEVLSAAEGRLAAGQPDFMLVHLHGIDDVATDDGPTAASTARVVAAEDAMVGELLRRWKGQVIVVADHGLHTVPGAAGDESRGRHGDFRSEDLLVPILIRTAGEEAP